LVELDLTEEFKITLKQHIFSTDLTIVTLEDINNQSILQECMNKLENKIKNIASRGKTSKLWIQYFYAVHL